jgi:hypothetical protein
MFPSRHCLCEAEEQLHAASFSIFPGVFESRVGLDCVQPLRAQAETLKIVPRVHCDWWDRGIDT